MNRTIKHARTCVPMRFLHPPALCLHLFDFSPRPTKHQAPKTKLQRSTKLQNSNCPAHQTPIGAGLKLGCWSFSGAWCLVLGASRLKSGRRDGITRPTSGPLPRGKGNGR